MGNCVVDRAAVAAKADEIEAELRRLYGEPRPPTPEQMDFKQAFAMDTMAFAQWVEWVLLPRVRELLDTGAPLPTRSMVGTQAVREFDGDPHAGRLTQLLGQFDALVEGRSDAGWDEDEHADDGDESGGSGGVGRDPRDVLAEYPEVQEFRRLVDELRDQLEG